MRYGGGGASAHLFLTDEAPVHGAGGVVPAPNRHSLQHLCFHDVTTVLIDVVVGLANLPKTTVRGEKAKEKSLWSTIYLKSSININTCDDNTSDKLVIIFMLYHYAAHDLHPVPTYSVNASSVSFI